MRKRGRGSSEVSSKKTKEATANDDAGDETASDSTTTTTWRDRITEFKRIVLLTFVIMLPYALYNGYLFVFLQRPEWLAMVAPSKWILRPSFSVSDARQVLIVGTQSSGTTQVADDLANKLGLEIGHENSETKWSFVRDGTVSWFHGIRFLQRPGIDDSGASLDLVFTLPPTNNQSQTEEEATTTVTLEGERLFRYVVNLICRELRPNMGFHPFMFRDNGECSLQNSWGRCWKDECTNLLEQEWGCALKDEGELASCTTPYHKTLLQFRNPLSTVQSLATKFCIGGVEGDVQLPFVVFASALFPNHDFSKLSCIEASGYYVYEYNRAVLTAAKNGLVDATYPVEGATPCQIARLAGFFDPSQEGYQQQITDHLLNLCSNEEAEVNQPMVSTKNKYNEGQLSLEWDDLLGGMHGSKKNEGDRDLQERLQRMTKELGYEF